MKKSFVLLVALGFLILFSNFTLAISFSASVNPNSTIINNSVTTIKLFNFTINNTNKTGANITQVNITWPSAITYVETQGTQTTATSVQLPPQVNNGLPPLQFVNNTSVGFVRNITLQYFWFNASLITPGTYNFTITTKDTSGISNTTNVSFEILGAAITNLPTTREYGGSSINISCSARSNSSFGNLGNMTIRISNLSYYNLTNPSPSWSTPVWGNNNTSTVLGTSNQSWWNGTLYGNYSDLYKYVVSCEANYTTGIFYSSNMSFIVSLRNFSGFVKNSTGYNLSNANVSIYRFAEGINAPPTETLVGSTTSGSDGNFTLSNVNTSRTCTPNGVYPDDISNPMSCEPNFRIKVVYPNESSATQVGPTLPPFPRQMIFGFDGPTNCPPGAPPGMTCGPPKLNGSTIYTQTAAIINLTAYNASGNIVNFGYEVMDKSQGFPIISCMNCNASGEAHIIVPTGRNYTVMIARNPDIYPPQDNNWTNCFNMSAGTPILTQLNCPSPPRSNSSISPTQSGIINISQDLSYSEYYLTGYINVTGNQSCSLINETTFNMTSILPKMIPWEGFVPPTKAIIQEFNASNDIGIGDWGSGRFWNYTLRVIGAVGGINYFMELYGNCSGEYFAAYQNVSVDGNETLNVTLRKLVGAYDNASSDVNTSKVTINLFKNSGNKTNCNVVDTGSTTNCQALSQPHLEIEVKHSNIYGGQSIKYMLDTITNGSFKMPFLSGSTVKLTIYEQGTSPIKKTINISQNVTNVTIFPFMPDKINTDGSKTALNKTGDEGSAQIIRFYRNSAECNVYNPPESSCALEGGNFSVSQFNPMSAMMAGKVNMRLISANVTLYFLNVDLLASGPPEPEKSESAMSGGINNASALQQAWKFGSMAPRIYDQVLIGMKDTSLNGSWSYNMSIPALYGENISATPEWSLSAGNTSSRMPDDYTDYNSSQYQAFLTSTGKPCASSNSSSECYINFTESKMWMKIPHFSGIQPTMVGSAPASTTTTTTTTTTGSTSGTSSGSTAYITLAVGKVNITSTSITTGSKLIATIAKYRDDAIRGINITVLNNVANIKIMITKLSMLPSTVSFDISGTVYHYINIEKINMTDSDIKQVNFTFAVNKTWLTDNGVDASNITLYRWANNKWNDLGATKVSEDTVEVFYTASSPGLSVFIIGTKGVQASPAPTGAAVTCIESWTCTDWSSCANDQQTRTCTDSSTCGTTATKPAELQSCQSQAAVITPTQFSLLGNVIIIVVAIIVCVFIFLERTRITYYLHNISKKSSKKEIEVYQRPKEEKHHEKK